MGVSRTKPPDRANDRAASNHHTRWRLAIMANTNLTPPTLTTKQVIRFWNRITCGYIDECWPWNGPCLPRGYGQLTASKRTVLTHRVAHFLLTGEWPPVVMHSCDNPPCCNPTHLLAGTLTDNNKDALLKGRVARGDRHSSRTHPESIQRGDKHWTRRYPERLPRGDSHRIHTNPELRARGERHGSAKLTATQVVEIRKLTRASSSQASIARKFGISASTVHAIINRRIWTHLL